LGVSLVCGFMWLLIDIGVRFSPNGEMSDFPAFLALKMRVSRRTGRRWFEAGKVPGAYKTKGGHWRVRKPRRSQVHPDDNITHWVMLYTLPPLERWGWRLAMLERRLAKVMDDAAPKLEDALECSMTAHGISEDDMRELRSLEGKLECRDPDKYRYLVGTRDCASGKVKRPPILEMIIPEALRSMTDPRRILRVKACKLMVNMRDVTPGALANELKISVATLYRRYGRDEIREVCKRRPASPLRAETLHPSMAEAEFPDRTAAKKTPTVHLNYHAEVR
jgi:hypothetical protein